MSTVLDDTRLDSLLVSVPMELHFFCANLAT